MHNVFIFNCIPTLLKSYIPVTVKHNKALFLAFIYSTAIGAKTFGVPLSHEVKPEILSIKCLQQLRI